MKKKHLFKVLLVAGLVGVAGFGAVAASVNAQSVYDQVTADQLTLTELSADGYTLEEMLTMAINDEYLAQAEYQAIIDTFGVTRPFTNIVAAEQTHIDLLLGLFETYGITVPENTAANSVVIPETITSAIATGVDTEKANIAMYEAFLAQGDLPEDVTNVFTYLVEASTHHLNAFSKDRYSCLGTDIANMVRNRFQKQGTKSQDGYRYQFMGANGNAGNCPNN